MRFQRYASPIAWKPEKPGALVVCCSDARFLPHLRHLIHAHIQREPDLLAIPGGPASIDPWASSFDHGRVLETSLHLLVEGHELDTIWLLAHEGCAFYLRKHGRIGEEALKRRQIRDLLAVRDLLLAGWPGLEVHPVYAVIEKGRVVFQEIKDAEARALELS